MKKIIFILFLTFPFIFYKQLISQPIYPPNGDTGTPVNFIFYWPEAPYVVAYGLQISYDPDFLNLILETYIEPPVAQYQLQSNLTYCTLHYWRYKVYVWFGGSYWSSIYHFTTTCLTSFGQLGKKIPNRYVLYQNYPNPFNPSTNIKFDIPSAGFTALRVYDVLGKEISLLVSRELTAGSFEVTFDGSILPSGIYYYKISSGKYTSVKKMVLIK